MPDTPGDITLLLHRWASGSRTAENELFELVLPELRRLAHYLMKGERKGHTLQATEVVDGIYARLVAARDRDWQNRQHFFAIAARAMRHYLIDHARGRPDAVFVHDDEFKNLLRAKSTNVDQAVAIDRLLDELAKSQPDWCRLVELKFFLGLTDEEAAEMLGLKLRTMQRMWMEARRWLYERMMAEATRPKESGDAQKSAGR
jgi:RNA polymerase sigma factor (TIGR02999 family)